VKLFWKITALEFLSALIIVAATRAYVIGSYRWTAIAEDFRNCGMATPKKK
jgi:hypothetical protein